MFYRLWLYFGPLSLLAQTVPAVVLGPMSGHADEQQASYWWVLDTMPKSSPKAEDTYYWPKIEADYAAMGSYRIEDRPLQSQRYAHHIVRRVFVERQQPLVWAQEDDWAFLLGSCAFQYQPPVLLGGLTRRVRNRIFEPMKDTPADFMLWLGDNVYFIGGQYKRCEAMLREYMRTRRRRPIREFLAAMPQYATWDDHDFGPNNSGGVWCQKGGSWELFKLFWLNPPRDSSQAYDDEEGVYTSFRRGDAEFFVLDSRYYAKLDSGRMLGHKQMAWLKAKLLASEARFKFIANGSQTLSRDTRGENMFTLYPIEREELLAFVDSARIKGLVFLAGDRHFTDLQRHERQGAYPLYEFTCSPLTSFMDPRPKLNMPERVSGTMLQARNYGRISFAGRGEGRSCLLEVFDSEGQRRWAYRLFARDLE